MTVTATVLVPAVVGVPLITPVLGSSCSPAGRLPLATDHVYGSVPPVAWKFALYGTPTIPEGSGVGVVIANEEMIIVTVFESSMLPARSVDQ